MGTATTIASSNEIGAVLRGGIRKSAHAVAIYYSETPEQRDQSGRVAYIAGKKLGGAVWRNRSRRVLRAALRGAGGVVPGYDILLVANARTSEIGTEAVAVEIARILAPLRAGQVQ